MKKLKYCVTFLFMLAIFACSENTGTSPGKVEDNTPFGWLEGGFTPETRFDRGGGLQKVAHSGDWIVLMDAWTSPVDSNDTLFGNYTYTPRLFISKIGSDPVVPPSAFASVKDSPAKTEKHKARNTANTIAMFFILFPVSLMIFSRTPRTARISDRSAGHYNAVSNFFAVDFLIHPHPITLL